MGVDVVARAAALEARVGLSVVLARARSGNAG